MKSQNTMNTGFVFYVHIKYSYLKETSIWLMVCMYAGVAISLAGLIPKLTEDT